jgi:chemotaxis family two-component system response regulator PixG
MNFVSIAESSNAENHDPSAFDSGIINPASNPKQISNGDRFRQLLADVWEKKATGRLSIVCPPHRWYLFFDAGQCLYATGSHHRMRRWNRSLQIGAPGLDVRNLTFELNQPWEYNLLVAAIEDGRLTIDQGVAVALVSLREIIFAIVSSEELTWHWQMTPVTVPTKSLEFWINHLKIDTTFIEAIRLYKQWVSLGLDLDYTNGAPLITKEPSVSGKEISVFASVRELLNGKHTFWDLALISPVPLAITARILRYFLQQGWVTFRHLPDLPIPSYFLDHNNALPVTALSYSPLIACIDDSVEVCHQVQQTVTDSGYRCLTISDPLQAVSQLMEHQPQFILLDLVMPVIGGYELCKQLRRVKMFETTPIVVLTSRSETIERLRSSMVGATDFLVKPLQPEALLSFLDHHFEHDINDRALTAVTSNGDHQGNTNSHDAQSARNHVA